MGSDPRVTFFDHGEAPGVSQGPQSQKDSVVFSNFWVPLETQKSTKNRSLAKKEAPGMVCLCIFVANVVLLTLGLDFSLIFHEKYMQILMYFFKAAYDFFNLANP